jgi:hypothetical protein
MPTNFDETLEQRYEREYLDMLDMYAEMTPYQIFQMSIELNNALAKVQEYENRDAQLGSCGNCLCAKTVS